MRKYKIIFAISIMLVFLSFNAVNAAANEMIIEDDYKCMDMDSNDLKLSIDGSNQMADASCQDSSIEGSMIGPSSNDDIYNKSINDNGAVVMDSKLNDVEISKKSSSDYVDFGIDKENQIISPAYSMDEFIVETNINYINQTNFTANDSYINLIDEFACSYIVIDIKKDLLYIDTPLITIVCKPSCQSCCNKVTYKWFNKTYVNYCPHCKKYNCLAINPKGVVESELTCRCCDSDYCGVCGHEKVSNYSRHQNYKLTPA